MKNSSIVISLFLFLFLAFATSCSKTGLSNASKETYPAWGVIKRVVPELEKCLILNYDTVQNKNEYYEYSSQEGVLIVKANSTVALCRGVNDFLKNELNCLISWDGDQITIPNTLPRVSSKRVTSPIRFRHYLNLCTFGYTMPFWDWKRWEREIDWMAMQGINMPLAMNGQEKVWKSVWEKLGMSDIEIRTFISGPAFLPWFRMGNLKSWAGPIPQVYIEHDAELQKKIVRREDELGMTPILPGFSGFVPNEIAELFPSANISKSSGWCGFEPTNLLEPRDSLFNLISKMFGEEYIKEFGDRSGYYIVDLYTEMKPQVKEETAIEELGKISSNVYNALQSTDSNAVWVMQGWMFHYEWEKFWNTERVESFLNGVPENKMIMLDLGAEREEIWRKYESIGNRYFIWNHLHNFGQHTNMFGMMDTVAKNPIIALNEAQAGKMIGMGLTMEGTEQNYIEYALMLDMMWRNEPIDIKDWLGKYAYSRWGIKDKKVKRIWETIYNKYYRKSGTTSEAWVMSSYQKRPSKATIKELEKLFEDSTKKSLIEEMLSFSDKLKKNPLYIRDLVDVSKDYFEECLGITMTNIINHIDKGEIDKADSLQIIFNNQLDDIDALLAVIDVYRIHNWIDDARKIANSNEDKDLMEKNARILVTVWGGNLSDYAHKEWSGLASQYYKKRWNFFFDSYSKPGFSFGTFSNELKKWEYQWCEQTELESPKEIEPINQIESMMQTFKVIKKR